MQPGMNWSGESPWQRLRRRKGEVLAEALELVEALAQELQVWQEERSSNSRNSSSSSWEENGFGVAERWESAETVREVVGLCVEILRANDPLAAHNLCRQLRRWRQENGRADRGWIEVRAVKGYGPYVYYRWRDPGSREIRTEYYGRADQTLGEIALDAALREDGREGTDEQVDRGGEEDEGG